MADVSFLRVGSERGGSLRRDSDGVVASIIHYRIDGARDSFPSHVPFIHQFHHPINKHTQLRADVAVRRIRDVKRHRIELPVFESVRPVRVVSDALSTYNAAAT